jgi:peptidoglycan/LPS O-acetylase OafA/YrhL
LPNSDRRNNFDLIRLFAAIQVIYNHTTVWLHAPGVRSIIGLVDMFPGVAIFFVVSGFLVTQSFVRNEGHVGRYAVNRALRIYPGLWLNFLVIMAMLAITGSLTLSMISPRFFGYLAAQFIIGSDVYGGFLSNFGYDFSRGHLFTGYPSGVLWTINVELGFYVLVPLVFCGAVRKRRWLMNTIIALSAAGSLWAATIMAHQIRIAPNASETFLLTYGPLPYFWIFLLGAAVSLNWDRVRFWFEDQVFAWLSGYLLLSMICVYGFHGAQIDFMKVKILVVIKMIALAGTVLSFAHSYRGLASFLRGNDISYGLYLYHMPIIFTLVGLGFHGAAWLWLAVYGAAGCAATLSWVLVERPALAFKRRGRTPADATHSLREPLSPTGLAQPAAGR